jgi:hypothetical protein
LNLDARPPFELHHGDCVGADKEAHDYFVNRFPFDVTTHAHPGIECEAEGMRAFCAADVIHEPMKNLERDDVVAAQDVLIALPRTKGEILRSGTWATVRYAARRQRPIYVIRPDGIIWSRFKSELARPKLTDHANAEKDALLF